MTKRPLIWITEQIHSEAIARLAEVGDLILPGADAAPHYPQITAIVVRAMQIPASLIAQMPSLRVVGKHGAGTDNIDLPALERAGIALHNAAGANADSVADLALTLALMLARSPDVASDAIKRGEPIPNAQLTGYELAELPCGILGLGAIGRKVAHRLTAGFGASVMGYDPGLAAQDWPDGVQRSHDLEAVLRKSRMLFLHLPLLPATRGLIGAEELAMMPEGSFVVNCARGGIVVESALTEALNTGHIAGAATDVFEQEPPSPHLPLLRAPRIIGLSHLGAQTHGALRRTGLVIVEKVLAELGT